MIDPRSKIYLAGHTGLIGSALLRALEARGFRNLVLRTHRELDLRDRAAAEELFRAERPDHVLLAAGVAGGIAMNRSRPALLLHENLAIASNVIDLAFRHEVRGLLFIGSGCAYPRDARLPIDPGSLLAGPVEATSRPFAVAKLAGVELCRAYNAEHGTRFIAAVPATVYGPGDSFGPDGHVIASLIDRFHRAKETGARSAEVWGTGRPRREFIYADDAAEALLLILDRYEGPIPVNVGPGEDISIAELAREVARTVGFEGEISFDPSRPDGMPARLLDSRALAGLGWRPRVGLGDGLARTYAWYCSRKRSTG